MSKSPKKRPPEKSKPSTSSAKPSKRAAGRARPENDHPDSKQSRVIAMLKSPAGATVAAMMKATGWQSHSVRGFLAGVVRKRLKLNLGSKKADGDRVYQITGSGAGNATATRQPNSRAA
jgi:hypothetical protein